MRYLLPSTVVVFIATFAGISGSPARAQEHINARARHKGTYNFFRTEPNRHSHIIEKMPQGTPFVITGESGKYYSIVLADGRTGWTARVNAVIEGQSPSADTEEEGGEEGRAAAPVVVVRDEPAAPVIVGKIREGIVPVERSPEVVKVVTEPQVPAHPVVGHAAHTRVKATRAPLAPKSPRTAHAPRAPRTLHTPYVVETPSHF